MKCTACPQINNIKEALFNSRYTLAMKEEERLGVFPPSICNLFDLILKNPEKQGKSDRCAVSPWLLFAVWP